jgi:hypothetical protein
MLVAVNSGRAHRTGPVVMLVQAPGYRIVRSPSACLNMRIFSSVVRRLPFIRLTPLAKVLRLTPFMGQFYEAQPPRRPRMGKEIRPGVAQTPAETQPGPVEEAGAACPTML